MTIGLGSRYLYRIAMLRVLVLMNIVWDRILHAVEGQCFIHVTMVVLAIRIRGCKNVCSSVLLTWFYSWRVSP